jgi:hypothetical protein
MSKIPSDTGDVCFVACRTDALCVYLVCAVRVPAITDIGAFRPDV